MISKIGPVTAILYQNVNIFLLYTRRFWTLGRRKPLNKIL